jgi:hypothetical protein
MAKAVIDEVTTRGKQTAPASHERNRAAAAARVVNRADESH